MLTQTDSRTLAYVNLFAVLGTLENLCDLVPEAKEYIKDQEAVSIGFAVKGGPSATISFAADRCQIKEGCDYCTIKLPFSSCEKFNGLIDGTVTPIPSKGFTKIHFLTKTFVPLTDLLTKYLRPTKEDLEAPAFREISTKLTLYTAAAAIAQVGNEDKSGRFSAGFMPDGDIAIDVSNVMGVTINIKDHHLTAIKRPCEKPRAAMTFSSLEITRKLLNGEASSMACICDGSIAMQGMVNMIDNMNRILDRVSQYLSV
ncbi:hypothetical protein [Sinanaerobacter chloroacetimidivorans]|uniref:SCP2 domain-containing protein n=1 Tax=Sinanaerobacter chloroacetimidivorans TaxID=2818044 RepID=A0A8J8B333_9FIRM|nr:hypothetical protein [Sinanaerobacter chloroacetimidivorans]MBR0599366.1 hypothetical protein [Sinanaerobacter chloroacetimidivorans]